MMLMFVLVMTACLAVIVMFVIMCHILIFYHFLGAKVNSFVCNLVAIMHLQTKFCVDSPSGALQNATRLPHIDSRTSQAAEPSAFISVFDFDFSK